MNIQEHPIVIEANAFIASLRLKGSGPAKKNTPRMDGSLTALLGCPYVSDVGNVSMNAEPCDADTLAARKLVLPEMFAFAASHGWHDDRLSLLAGLNRSNCWASRCNDVQHAYDLTEVLVDFVDFYWESHKRYATAAPDVLGLLNAWLKPDIEWSTLPGVRTLCQHLFGDSWCLLVLPDEYADTVGARSTSKPTITLSDFIIEHRPLFLPGLCTAQDTGLENSKNDLLVDRLPELDSYQAS
jgi:hypothetical protein